MRNEAPAISAGAAAVVKAWPVVAADHELMRAYDAALAELDVALVRDVVGSLAHRGAPAPSPGMLRTVVQSRQAAPRRSGVTSDRRPTVAAVRATPWTPPASAARREPPRGLAPMIVAGLAGVGAALASRQTWVTVEAAGRSESFSGAHVAGGDMVWSTLLVTLAALAIGVFYVHRGRSTRHLRWVFGVLAGVSAVAVYGAVRGFRDVADGRDGLREMLRAAFGGRLPAGAEDLLAVDVGQGLWAALILASVALVAALYGLVTARGGPG